MPFFKRKKGKRLTKEKQFSAMESENAASEAGLLEPVLPGSRKFQEDILPALQRSYMYSESETCFRYSSAHLINNATLQKEYQAFRAEKRGRGYTEEELEESFSFLLFDHEGKAKELSESGLVVGHSTCSTLGDPSKGVYISKYSDCLDFNPWYHGKSGYIAILRLTKGRVRTVMENYTRNFTLPSPGFDSHVSEQIGAVSSTTSSFLAYERTQYYLYEACGHGDGVVARPRHVLPFAIVEFSYGETKPCAEVLQEKSVEKPVVHYHPWRGQLQIQSHIYRVALRSNTGALIPAQLPETLVTDRIIQLSDLRKLLPQGIFETCFTGEVSLEGRFYTLFEVVTPVADDASVPVLLQELKEKELALLVQLNDSGFLVLLHSSYFLTYEDPMSERTEKLLAMFVFPDSRTVQKATKIMRSSSALSPEVMQILPGLNYAETEVEKCPPDQQEALCELVEQRLQNYATLIQPGMLDSPSREASGFPDQYDMPEVFKHLYSAPKCDEATLRRLQAYLGQPDAYTLPVARAVELLAVGRRENDDDSDVIYCCLSSPEEVPATPAGFPGDGNAEESQRQSDGHVEGVGMEGGAVPEGGAEGGAGQHQEGEEEATLPIAASQPPIPEDHGALGTAVLTYAEPSVEVTEATPTPMSGDLPIDLSAVAAGNGAVTSQPGDVPVRETGTEGSVQGGVFTRVTEKAGDSLSAKGPHTAESISLVHTTPVARPPTGPTRGRATRRSRRRKKKSSNPAEPKALAKDPRVEEEAAMTQPQTLKRKGFRYGLKTIITDCGRVFIPHGSEIPHKDIISPVETANRQAVSIETAKGQTLPVETADRQSPRMETTNRQTPPTEIADRQTTPIETVDRQTSPMETADRKETGLSCELPVGTVVSPPVVADQNKDPENKIPPDKTGLLGTPLPKTLISLGELRTILQKRKRRKARSLDDQTFPALKEPPVGDNSEPQHKRSKSDACPENDPQEANRNCGSTVSPVGTNLLQSDSKLMNVLGSDPKPLEKTQRPEGSPKDRTRPRRNSPRRADVVKFSPRPDEALKAVAPQTTVAEIVKLVKPFKKRLRSRITECMKENGWLNFGNSASQDSEKVVQAQAQSLRTATSGHRTGAGGAGLNLDWGPPSQCQPSDALTLLADLALGGGGDETIEKLTPGLETKLSGRGRRHPHRRKLPLKASASGGLVVSGELVLVISKEHSYSLPPSCLLLGLSGEPLQVSPPDSTESSLPSGQQGPPQHADKDDAAPLCPEERGREEVTSLPPGSQPPKHSVSVRRKKGRGWFRRVVQAGETIRVTRLWKEKYEFSHDSKYTNDPLDKTVIRALHGPWDFRIEETIDQARLILHMWIGLFYSRSTTRFFQTDPNGPVLEGPPPAESLQEELQDKAGTKGVTDALPGSETGSHPSEMQHYAPPAFSPPPESEALDLREESKKKAEPLLPAPKVLDLSKKRSEVLDLSVTSKPIREACPPISSHTELAKTPPPHLIHKPTPRRYNCTVYPYYPCKDTSVHFNHQEYRASDSSYASVQGSLHRTPEALDACSQRGSLQHGFRDRKSRSGHASAHDPPAHSSRKPRPSSKRPVMAVRPCKSEAQEGDGFSVLLEGDKMKSLVSVKGSYDAAAKYAGRLRKRRLQQEGECEEEEYSMLIDRESVSSGSLSGEINGDEAAGSPTADNISGSDLSHQWNDQDADDVLGHTTTEPCTGFPYQSQDEWDSHEMVDALDFSKTRPMNLSSDQSEGLGISRVSFLGPRTESSAKETDWLSYCRSRKREGSSQSWVCKKEGKSDNSAMTPSIITVLDHKGNRKTYENYPIVKTVSSEHTRTIQNSSKGSSHLFSFFQRWDELHHSKPDLTQSSLDLEYLIFSEKMSQMLKKTQRISSCSGSTRYPWRKLTASDADSAPCGSPMRVQFSGLEDCVSEDPHDAPMSLVKWKIKVDMPERAGLRASEPNECSSSAASETPLRLRLPYANGVVEPCPAVADIVAECARTYHGMMNDVCSGKRLPWEPERFKKERSSEWHNADFCSEIEDMTVTLHDDLNTIVRQSFKVKFRFYVLVTSADAFFEQTKEVLEAEGHVSVEPEQFDLGGRSCHTPLLIILRNEDIAEHVSEIPHLLELKKTPSVLFAGVDHPDDVLNLTHQELFSRGGFVVCDRAALDTLSLDNIKMLVGFLDDLSKKGKWKWFLHYKDSRKLRENARSSTDARELKQFVDYCQEAGLVEVLPYHECDVISRDRPDYLLCLLRLQVQNATARFPIFITDTPEDSFGKCGIFAMNINTFLRISKSDTCTIL
ncbi:hypothetical protein MATL_G00261920 [Megalops atlanticus]|uniref:DUF3715 domain-containing protein n=1 Tax=Megalops atlanticus TaxID=7932 RepID=A0A9D3PC49_MEGAT|nr:hypothetical protein MATL_G00261920 [Megalops atlanticus]